MGSEWVEFLLGEKCTVKSSKRIFAHEYVDSGIPFMRSKDVIDKALGCFENYDLYISADRFLDIKKSHGSPEKGDLLMSSVGNRSGQPYVIQDEGDFHFKDGNILWLSNFDGINSNFLAYWLKSEIGQSSLISVMIGSAQKALTIDSIRKLRVKFPPIEYQNFIVENLINLDQKITLNRQTNNTLESMAQTLFKSWFVDFDPVFDNALAAGKKIEDFPLPLQTKAKQRQAVLNNTETHTSGGCLTKGSSKKESLAKGSPAKESSETKKLAAASLATETPANEVKNATNNNNELFPSDFEQTGLDIGIEGWVPLGWGGASLNDLVKFGNERCDVENLTNTNYISTENMLSDKKGVKAASSLPTVKTLPAYSAGDILVSNIRPYFKKIWLADADGGRSNDVLGFQALIPETNYYIMNLLYQDQFFDYMMTTSKGSKMPRGDKVAIMNWPAVFPGSVLMKKFSKQVFVFYQALPSRLSENKSFEILRDTLLPKLISGELTLENINKTSEPIVYESGFLNEQ